MCPAGIGPKPAEKTITYDAIGNPTSYYNGTHWAMGWQNGRQLASASNGTTTVTYTYDQDGIRDSKKVGDVTYNYITQNGKVVRQTWGNETFDIIYDPNGRPFACRYNDVYYVYVLNLQGDVIRVINGSNGATVAEYQYDAWGNILSATGWMASINPIRYRGYYYDTETGFYYLQSRYYDPTIGRFINADSFASTGQGFLGYNMFAYCGNNPVSRIDVSGDFWGAVVGGAVAGALVSAVSYLCTSNGQVDVLDLTLATLVGAFNGAVGAIGGLYDVARISSSAMVATVTAGIAAYNTDGNALEKLTVGLTAGAVAFGATYCATYVPVADGGAIVEGITSYAGALATSAPAELVNVAAQTAAYNIVNHQSSTVMPPLYISAVGGGSRNTYNCFA